MPRPPPPPLPPLSVGLKETFYNLLRSQVQSAKYSAIESVTAGLLSTQHGLPVEQFTSSRERIGGRFSDGDHKGHWVLTSVFYFTRLHVNLSSDFSTFREPFTLS